MLYLNEQIQKKGGGCLAGKSKRKLRIEKNG